MRVVLAVLTRKLTVTQAAEQAGVSESTVKNWKRRFIQAGRNGLAAGSSRTATRIERLHEENLKLAKQLEEARVLLRVWQKSAERE